jgi:hypothetical protein
VRVHIHGREELAELVRTIEDGRVGLKTGLNVDEACRARVPVGLRIVGEDLRVLRYFGRNLGLPYVSLKPKSLAG